MLPLLWKSKFTCRRNWSICCILLSICLVTVIGITHKITLLTGQTITTTTTAQPIPNTCNQYSNIKSCELRSTCEWNSKFNTCELLNLSWDADRPCPISKIHSQHARRCLLIIQTLARFGHFHPAKVSTMRTLSQSISHLFQMNHDLKFDTLQEMQDIIAWTRNVTGVVLPIVLMGGTGGSGSRAFVRLLNATGIVVPVANNRELDFLMGNGGSYAGRNLKTWMGNPCPYFSSSNQSQLLMGTLHRTTIGLIAACFSAAFTAQSVIGPTRIAMKHGSLLADAIAFATLLQPENVAFVHYVRNGRHMIVSRNSNQLLYYSQAYAEIAPHESSDVQKAKLWSLLNVAMWRCFRQDTSSLLRRSPYVLVRYDDFVDESENSVPRELQDFLTGLRVKLSSSSKKVQVDMLRRSVFVKKGKKDSDEEHGNEDDDERIRLVLEDENTAKVFEQGMMLFGYA